MQIELEKECPCAKTSCERRGNCVACHDNHKGKDLPPACRRPETAVSPDLNARVDARLRAAGRI